MRELEEDLIYLLSISEDFGGKKSNKNWLTELNFEKRDVGWTISVDGGEFVIMESSMNDGTWSILTLKFGHDGPEGDTIFEIKYVHELQHFLRLLYAKMTWE